MARRTGSKAGGSSRAPVGRPSLHTISALPSSARGPSMPAAARAAGVASAVWKSKNVSSAGAPPTASATSSPDSSIPSNVAYSSEWPVTHCPGPQRARSAVRAARTSSTVESPARSAPTVSSAPISGCWCESTRPGTSASPRPSIVSVRASQAARTVASSPTATIVPSRQATAVAHGRAGSSVRIRAPSTAASAELRIGGEPSGHDCGVAAATRKDVWRAAMFFTATSALIGLSFGVLARTSGISLAMTCAMSLLVFAGGAQFLAIATIASGGTPLAVVARRDRAQRAPPAVRARRRAVPARPALEARALEPDRARRVDGARARPADAGARQARVLRLRLLAVRRLEPRHADRRARGRRDRRPLRARARRRVPGQHARPARAAAAPARRARGRARRRRHRARRHAVHRARRADPRRRGRRAGGALRARGSAA